MMNNKPQETLLSVKNLSIGILKKRSSNKEEILSSVEDISFDINSGEILGLLGESGSGKSLTALSIIRLLSENKKLTGGSIYFGGADSKNILNLSEKEMQSVRGKDISMIFQEPFSSLNPLMKIGAQIAETLELHDEKDKAQNQGQVREILGKLKFTEPEKLLARYPHQLSGGMCQRVMIALAIICRPRLLIADEPTTALDKSTQNEIISLLKTINRDFNTSILFISHDLGVVKELCSRLLIMYSGRILEEGTTEEVFSHPAHEYTKGLMGSIPAKASKGKNLVAIPGKIPSLEEGRPQGCPFHPRCGKAEMHCQEKKFPGEICISKTHKTHCVLATQFPAPRGGT
jgi:oligopeptide/dipeptide ABC transporter ATP-binding protein